MFSRTFLPPSTNFPPYSLTNTCTPQPFHVDTRKITTLIDEDVLRRWLAMCRKREKGVVCSRKTLSETHTDYRKTRKRVQIVFEKHEFSHYYVHTLLFFFWDFSHPPKFPRTIPLHYRKSGKQKENFLLFISLVCLTKFFLLSKSLPSLVSLSFKQLYSAVIDANKLKAQVNGEKCSSAV